MPRPSDKDRIKKFQSSLVRADKAFEVWERKFRCAELESLYDGTGHWTEAEDPRGERYVINRVFASIETRTPTLLFFRPKARIVPRPTRADDPGSLIDERALLLEDHADTLVADERVGFMDAVQEAQHDANFYFGVVEIGYSADWVDNPSAGKPVLKDDGTEVMADGKPLTHPERVINSESMYVKRIPPEDFRVPLNAGSQNLDQLDWYGYYEWHYVSDVKANPAYKNTSSLKPTGKSRKEYQSDEDAEKRDGMVRLFKSWHNREKIRRVHADGHDKFLLEEPFKHSPHEDLKFHRRRREWYPIPPVFNWRSPQREHNEIREDMKEFRRAALPRYTYTDGAIDQAELDKLMAGGAYTIVKANRDNPITEIPRSEGRMSALRTAIPDTRDDFNEASSLPGEHNGVADADTATQASIIDINARVRESSDREKVAKFLGRVIKKLLLISKEKMSLPTVIKIHVDPLQMPEPLQREVMRVAQGWAAITHEALGDFEFDCSVDVEALSPATEDLRRNQWLNFIGVMGTPGALPVLASETLLKKTAAFFGIRSAREVEEIRGSVLQAIMVQTQMGMAAKGVSGQGGTASGGTTPAVPSPVPSQDQTRAQMSAQGVGIQ